MNINFKTRQIPYIMLADEKHQAQSPKAKTSFIYKQQRTLQGKQHSKRITELLK